MGHAYESFGTFTLEGEDPKKRFEMFEQAISWYQKADETVGFYTDYALRQAESCLQAASFGRKSGLEDDITRELFERGNMLIQTLIGGITRVPVTIISRETLPKNFIEAVRSNADECVESGDAKAYLSKDHSEDHLHN